MKLTVKQDAFARAYVETGCASAAYRRVYDAQGMKENVIHVKACELLKNGKVAVRVEQLQRAAAKRHEITVDRLSEMAAAAYELAMKPDVQAPAAAVSAVLALGKLHGLIVDKKEVTRKRDAADLTDAELYAIARMGRTGDPTQETSPQEPDRVH